MRVWPLYKHNLRDLFRHWGAYLILIAGTNLVISLAIVPLLDRVTQAVLLQGKIPYLTLTNLGTVIVQAPLTAFLLVLIGLLVLLLVYWQFAFLLIGIQNIHQRNRQSLWQHIVATFQTTRRLTPTAIGILLIYFVLLYPFARFIFNTDLLTKLTIPDFIVAYVFTRLPLAILLVTVYIVTLWLAIRLMPLLPGLVLGHEAPGVLLRKAFGHTRHLFWATARAFLFVIIPGIMFLLVMYLLAYGWQDFVDTTWPHWSMFWAVVDLGILQLTMLLYTTYWTVMLYQLSSDMASDAGLIAPIVVDERPVRRGRKVLYRLTASFVVLVIIASTGLFNWVYFAGLLDNTPLTISHRGVDDGNGVQNTIPALLATAKEKPDYVEMDLHETKDHQFVVMHDENLENLTGVNKTPHQLTLAQLTALTASENGHQAKVASFDAYLAAAESVHQKLLVEIKTTPQDSPQMMTRFIQKYAKRLEADHDQMHSLDYHVVTTMRKRVPQIKTSFILPYTLVYTPTPASGYTVEMTTLDDNFVASAAAKQQYVYAWTINSEDDMQKVIFENVNGVITDQLGTLKTTIKSLNDHPSYADQLLNFTVNLSSNANSPLD